MARFVKSSFKNLICLQIKYGIFVGLLYITNDSISSNLLFGQTYKNPLFLVEGQLPLSYLTFFHSSTHPGRCLGSEHRHAFVNETFFGFFRSFTGRHVLMLLSIQDYGKRVFRYVHDRVVCIIRWARFKKAKVTHWLTRYWLKLLFFKSKTFSL